MLTPKITGWSDGYEREVESFVSRIAVRFIGKHNEHFPYRTFTVGENWLHLTSLTYKKAKESEIKANSLIDSIFYTSTMFKQTKPGRISLETILGYTNLVQDNHFAIIPLTDDMDKEVEALGIIGEKTDFYRIKYNNSTITVVPNIIPKETNALRNDKRVYVFINSENMSTKIH